ncbi:MAG: short-chain fatty acyl-CoA regulator family protein [Parvularculaceae bacterium]
MSNSREKLFIGPKLRRLRMGLGLTQARMAEELAISASYLNLIEANSRPVSAQLLLQLVSQYDVNVAEFGGDGDARLVAELHEMMRDPMLKGAGKGIGRAELEDMVNASPGVATAVLKLYEKTRDTDQRTAALSEKLSDRDKVELLEESARAVERVRRFIQENSNYYPELDEAAELLFKELDLGKADTYSVLCDRLAQHHDLKVRIVPTDVMSHMLRFYDRHSRRINLSELLGQSGRCFQLAYQIGMLEQRKTIDRAVASGNFADEETISLARVTLANYFAAALLMPYRHFLEQAEGCKYDIDMIAHRFGTSYEQVAHRLTTLQRPGHKGIPFFFIRIDIAGNVSKRFSPGNFHFARFGGTCPLWNIHESFQTPGKIHTQIVQLPDDATYFSVAKTVHRAGGSFSRPGQQLAVGLGCHIKYARRLVYAESINIETPQPTPIGINCYLCERDDCAQRAFAPLNRAVRFDERARGTSQYQFDPDS